MTVTKKIGGLLILLTVGSLVGTLAFAWFFVSSAGDGLFLVASANAQVLVERVYSQGLLVAHGDETAKDPLRLMSHDLDSLIDAMALGGTDVRAGQGSSSAEIVKSVLELGKAGGSPLDLVARLSSGLPKPSAALAEDAAKLRAVWADSSPVFRDMTNLPPGVQALPEALARLNDGHDALTTSVRHLAAAVGIQLIEQRQRMLVTLAGIAVLSVALFFVGLWYAKRRIAAPISDIEKATSRARTGDFSYTIPVPAHSDDEIASLARTFNAMSNEIGRLLERDRELFENAADFVYTVDLDGRFLSVNRAGERISGFSREELLSRRFEDLLAPEQEDRVHEMLARKISGEQKSTTYEVEILTSQGRRVYVENHTRLVLENGHAVAVQGVARDVTERRRLQDQLWTSQKMDVLGRLAGGLAHDFGNILTIVMGYCTLLSSSLGPTSRERTEVEGIQKAAERAAALIRHLLGFAGGQVFRPRVIAIGSALKEMIEMLRRLIGEDIHVIADIQSNLGAVRFDPNQLEQVIVNLALNARDAMPNGGTLTIRAFAEDSPPAVRIIVADTGAGMPPDVVERVFEPFFTTKRHGTGLGLSTAHAILRQTGSAITVESTVGEGTTFSIRIPRSISAHQSDLPVDDESVEKISYVGGTILLVEDEADVRRLIRDMLKTYGYSVVEASNQTHAIEICESRDQRIDVMLTDVVMPNMSGPELVKLVTPIRPRMKVIYMSGHPRDRFTAAGVDTDTANFIQKPVSPEALAIRLREAMSVPSRVEMGGNGLGGRN